MRTNLFLPLLLLSMCGLPAEDGPLLSNRLDRALPLIVEDLSVVAKARLYVTRDHGASWMLAQELTIPAGSSEAPRFAFTAPGDGVYGFASAVVYSDGKRELEPQPGEAPQARIRFDSTPPVIASFIATTEVITDSNASLRLAWEVKDPLLDDQVVTVEVSGDAGTTFAPLVTGGASGNLVASVAVPSGTKLLLVRLRAKDLAGNITTSPTTDIAVGKPTTEALAEALAALPHLAGEGPKPVMPPAPAPVPEAVSNRPDIVVPQPAEAPPAPPAAEIEVVTGGGLQAEIDRRRAEERQQESPSWQRPGRSHLSMVESVAPAVTTGASEPNSLTPAADRAPEVARPREPAATARPPQPAPSPFPADVPPAGRLSPQQAQSVLTAARVAAQADDSERAHACYRRLRDTTLADVAILEEIRLWRSAGSPGRAVAMAAEIPANHRSDAVTLEEARALLDLNSPDRAMEVLGRVRRESPSSAEALFLMGRGLALTGKHEEARKVFTWLVQQGGTWGDQAKAELGGR